MKILILCSAVIAALAEPPVNNRYLPPSLGQGFSGGFGGPSQTYGPPGSGNGFGSQRQTDAVFRGQPSSSYGAPSFNSRQSTRPSSQFGSRTPSSQYGAPNRGQGPASQFSGLTQGTLQAPSSQYGASGFNQGSQNPSAQYGAPSFNQGSQTPSSQYGAPGFNRGSQAPSSQYGAPGFNQGSQAPSSQYGAPGRNQGNLQTPSSQYGAPGLSQGSQAPSSQYGAPSFGRQQNKPSQQYGAPGIGGVGGGQFSQNGLRPDVSQGYLPPGAGVNGGYAGDDGSNGEPANYSFEYMVKDEPSGNDFGHRESRQGDRAEGLYYVLLPDGRKQTVQYEADENGYKPRISYEDTGLGLGGYDRNSQGSFGNDYQNQGGYQ